MECECPRRCRTRCNWCDLILACSGCKKMYSKCHRLEPKVEPITSHWADFYDLEFPFACDECYTEHDKKYNIIETFNPTGGS